MPFSKHRALIQALMLSASVHAALLLGVVTTHRLQPGAPAPAMNVVIARDQRVEPIRPVAAVPAPPGKARDPVPLPRPEPRKAAPASTTRAVRRAEPVPPRIVTYEASPVAVPESPVSADAAGPPTVSAPASVPNGGAVQGEAPAAQDGVSADDLRRYRVSLASAARRFKRYPALAREQGWEGTVDVAIRVRSALPTPDVVLVCSSGHDLLDEQAVQMMAQAARATTLPEGLRGRDLEIPLPVKFSLDEAQ
ncbi:MAG: energy transducer TonB [Propionivibrio sp.]